MDRRNNSSSHESQVEGASEIFSEADFSCDAGRVIAHAAATGTAVVAAADGRPRVVITIPTVDLPTLGE
jgi:hypothetical protein